MRLKFVKGKQHKLIRNFKTERGLTWKQLADLLKIKEGRLKAYVEETSLISEEIYNSLDEGEKYKKFVLERREDNWGGPKEG
ncbi:MAG: hypothetical protein KKB31_03545 [Nanoarchaeota archaeon]|nr:hypothetical protein [Nanoarchaeota archaeon]